MVLSDTPSFDERAHSATIDPYVSLSSSFPPQVYAIIAIFNRSIHYLLLRGVPQWATQPPSNGRPFPPQVFPPDQSCSSWWVGRRYSRFSRSRGVLEGHLCDAQQKWGRDILFGQENVNV